MHKQGWKATTVDVRVTTEGGEGHVCTSTDVSTAVGKHNACVVILHGGVVVSMQGNEGRITPTLKNMRKRTVLTQMEAGRRRMRRSWRRFWRSPSQIRCAVNKKVRSAELMMSKKLSGVSGGIQQMQERSVILKRKES